MSNYAIVLGVDQYQNLQALPSCENDAALIEGFLTATGKYKVLRIPNNATKYQVQERIADFLPTDESEVSEVLFYFSGHGKQDDLGMHYALFGTKVDKINSTSLNNTEVDDLVRKCSPKLYVKIIDSCQSGVAYIKGAEEKDEESVGILTKGFENCIFMYSSLKTQPSLTGNPYSKFTKAVIDAIENISAPVVKFTDIQNYLSDIFNSSEDVQTPYFSMQCDGTEVFCEKTAEVLEYLKTFQIPVPSTTDSLHTVIETVKEYLKKCRDATAVKVLMDKVHTILSGWKLEHDLLSNFYECICTTNFPYIYDKYHEDRSIAKMLHSRVEKENLFVEVECESTKKENPLIGPFFSSLYDVPVSYRSLANQLPSVFSLHFRAIDDNLPDYVVPFIFVYSSTFFYVFMSTRQFVRKGWGEHEPTKCSKYVYTKFEYDSFTESKWEAYLIKRMEEAIQFIDKTLIEFIEME